MRGPELKGQRAQGVRGNALGGGVLVSFRDLGTRDGSRVGVRAGRSGVEDSGEERE